MTTYYLPGGSPDDGEGALLPRAWQETSGSVGPPQRRRAIRSVLRRRVREIALGFIAIVGAVTAVSFVVPPRYESTASFLIEEARPTSSGAAALAMLERLGRSRSAETEVALLRSHSVLEPVIDALDLHVVGRTSDGYVRPASVLPSFSASRDARPGRYTITREPSGAYTVQAPGDRPRRVRGGEPVALEGVTFSLPAGDDLPSLQLDVAPFGRVVERVRRRVRVRPADKNAEVILVTCDARTPVDAQQLCSELSDSYLRLRSTLQVAEASAAAMFLAEQVDQVVVQLTAAEEQVREHAMATRGVALDTRAKGEVARFIEIKAQREALAGELEALQSLIVEIEGTGGTAVDYRRLASFPTFLKSQNQVVPQLLESLVQLENRRSELALRRSEVNPDLMAVNQRIADIQSQLRSLAATYRQGLVAQIASLDAMLARAGHDLDAIPTQEIAMARLRRQVLLLEELYHFLQTRLKEAEVARAVNLPSVRIVDAATLPFRISSPNIPLNVGLAVVLGLGFGLMLGLYREYSDTRIYEREEVEHGLGLRVVGMVARLADPGPIRAVPPPSSGSSRALVGNGRGTEQREIAWEAFHGMVTDIRFSRTGSEEGGPRSIAVTSTSRGEGKTFVSCNLATAWATFPAKTLILDTDLRASAASRFFGVKGRPPGLTEVLLGEIDATAAVQKVTVEPGVELDVIPAGRYPGRSAELFDTPAFDELMDWAASEYDLVVVDTPPLNVLSDAAIVAAHVDAVLVVVRGGVTERAALDLTLRRIARAGGHVEGIVLNDVDLPAHYVRYSRLAV